MNISFPYPGGKAKIREQLLMHFPEEGRHYMEPFVGRGNIFFEYFKICSFKEYIINDLNTARFFRALRDANLDGLPREVKSEMFEVWSNRYLIGDDIAAILEPVITFRGKGFDAGCQIGRYKRPNYKAKCQAAQNIMRSKGITVCKNDYVYLPWHTLEDDDFVYCDPPYLDTTGVGYKNINHEELLSLLIDTPARWAISGYLSDLYIQWLGEPVLTIQRNVEMTDTKGSTAVECLWVS